MCAPLGGVIWPPAFWSLGLKRVKACGKTVMTTMKAMMMMPAIMIHHSPRYLRRDAENQRRTEAAPPAGEKRAAGADCRASAGCVMRSSILHPRVDGRIDQVHQERHGAHEKRVDHDHPLDRRIIAEVDALQEQPAHAGPREGALREDCPGKEEAELEARAS